MKDNDINRLIFRRLIDNITDEDNLKLDEWINKSKSNREYYEHICNHTNFSSSFRTFDGIDTAKAWHNFEKECLSSHHKLLYTMWQYAAILIIPIVGIALWFGLGNRASVSPQLSKEARAAMMKSEQVGKDQATLILSNGQKVALSSAFNNDDSDSLPVKAQMLASSLQANQNNILVTRKNSEYWLTFEDGTVVHLNYNTTLRYPAHFSDEERTVYLEGEAYFQVAKDSKRPFNVVTSSGIVREYGTTFNVNTRVDGGGLNVVLVDGSIGVTPQNGKEYMIKPGELAEVQAGTNNILISRVDVEPYVAWNNGRFVFENYTLERMMNVISQWYGMKVRFSSEDIKQMHFTGDMDRYGSFQPILSAIRNVTRLDVQVRGNYIFISNPITN